VFVIDVKSCVPCLAVCMSACDCTCVPCRSGTRYREARHGRAAVRADHLSVRGYLFNPSLHLEVRPLEVSRTLSTADLPAALCSCAEGGSPCRVISPGDLSAGSLATALPVALLDAQPMYVAVWRMRAALVGEVTAVVPARGRSWHVGGHGTWEVMARGRGHGTARPHDLVVGVERERGLRSDRDRGPGDFRLDWACRLCASRNPHHHLNP
jgi:hypothetical protein